MKKVLARLELRTNIEQIENKLLTNVAIILSITRLIVGL